MAPGGVLALKLFVVALVYYSTARLGLLLPYVGSHVSLVWLPTGIAVAAYLRWGSAMAWAVCAAAALVNYQTGGPAWMGVGIALGNTLGPWVSTVLLRRWSFDPMLTRWRDLGVYVAAVMLGMVITASNGTLWLRAADLLPVNKWASAWMTWWIGDAVGALLGGVPLITLTRATLRDTFGGRSGMLNGALLGTVLLCGLLGFSPWSAPPAALFFPLLSLPLFVAAVLALRAGVLAASLAVLVLSATAAWGTAGGVGPFAGHDAHAGLLALWSYIAAQACTSVLICGLAAELLATRRQQAALFEHANEGILLVGPDGLLGAANPVARAMFAVSDVALRGFRLVDLPFGNGPALMTWLRGDASLPDTRQRYLHLSQADGSALEVEAQTASHHDARGRLMTQIMLRDVTERRHAERQLAASERRLHSIADQLPMRVSFVDSDERYRFVNLAYERAFGRPREALYGLSVRDVLGEGAYAEAAPRIHRTLLGEHVSFDSEMTTHEGYRCYRASYMPQFADDGKTVLGFVAIVADTTAQKLEERRLIELSQLDSLTGLLNRAGFEQRRHEAFDRSCATRGHMALMLLDIDGFKHVNDTRGHLAGDMLLRGFAGRLMKTLRAIDIVARPGGDEFAVILENLATPQDAATIARNIVAAMQAPFILETESLHITTSIGVALFHGEPGVSSHDLIKRADELLYAAKAQGRNRCCIDDPSQA
jgi:diguanylate cyclase (GGDEF)-like protein/PAS domain S-box-containing protein